MKTINKQTLSEANNLEENKLSQAVRSELGINKNAVQEVLEKESYSDILEKAQAILTRGKIRQIIKAPNNIRELPRERRIDTSEPVGNILKLAA